MDAITEQSSRVIWTPSVEQCWIRRAKPLGLFYEGAIAILALLALIVYAAWSFARHDIEAIVESETRALLNAQGYDWVQVSASGQDVRLSGVQPVARGGDAALAIARTTRCPTWVGRLGCPLGISGRFSDPAAGAPALVADAGVTQAAGCEDSFNDIVGQSKIEFSPGSAEIDARSDAVLDALAKAARNCDGVIRIEGHTDSAGAARLNVSLSAARATAVAAALVERGIPRVRLQAHGFGSEHPVADNATVAGRAKNRRIEFHVFQKEVESKGDES